MLLMKRKGKVFQPAPLERKRELLLNCWSRKRKTWTRTRTRIAFWYASSNQSAMNYVIFNLISVPSVHSLPPVLSSGTCRMQEPLHNTTKTISWCGSRLEYPPRFSPEHQIIIRGFVLEACIKLIAHTGNRARKITYKNGFHLALMLLLKNTTHFTHLSSRVIYSELTC